MNQDLSPYSSSIADKSSSVYGLHGWRGYTCRPDLILGIYLAAVISLILIGFLNGTLSIKTVFAKGSVEIVAANPEIKVSILQANTDDPLRTLDPGLEEDVADCRARVKAGNSLSLSILNGYPGYACTLQTTLENRGQEVVRLNRMEFEVPNGLVIQGPESPEELVLSPGQREQQEFILRVTEAAGQGSIQDFHIWQVFTARE